MSETTGIAWCDSTFNPFIGCSKVSPGCQHCYAEAYGHRFGVEWGPGNPRRRTSAANWRKPLAWDRKAAHRHCSCGHAAEEHAVCAGVCGKCAGKCQRFIQADRPRVFCGSLMDWLDPEVPAEWLADLLALIAATPHLDWLLLTKRPELWKERIGEALSAEVDRPGFVTPSGEWMAAEWYAGKAPDNVWIGTTVEDQRRADERHEHLRAIPARVRFYSGEPLLGLTVPNLDGIHWVICGGESGPNARPMNTDWARSLRDQCKDAGVPFLHKQNGEWGPVKSRALASEPLIEHFGERPYGKQSVIRVGKKAAGRLLDGVIHNEFPS